MPQPRQVLHLPLHRPQPSLAVAAAALSSNAQVELLENHLPAAEASAAQPCPPHSTSPKRVTHSAQRTRMLRLPAAPDAARLCCA